MIIGFGATEEKVQTDFEEKVNNVVKESLPNSSDYFSESFVSKVNEEVEKLSKDSREKFDLYRTAEKRPDRVSFFYISCLGDANNIVFIVKWTHVNTKHLFSPDGWATLESKQVFSINYIELKLEEEKKNIRRS